MKPTTQYCWRNDACQKVNCKFVHSGDQDSKHRWNVMATGMNDESKLSTPVQQEKVTESNSTNFNRSLQKSATSTPLHAPPLQIQQQSKNNSDLPRDSAVNKSKKNRQSSNVRSSIEQQNDVHQKRTVQRKLVDAVITESGSKPLDVYRTTKTSAQLESGTVSKATGNRESNVERYKKVNESNATEKRTKNKNSANKLPHRQHVQSKKKNFVSVEADENEVQFTNSNSQPSGEQPQESANRSRRHRRYGRKMHQNSESSREQQPQQNVAQRVDFIQKDVTINMNQQNARFYQRIVPIQPEWNSDESEAITQHKNIIDGIKEKISRIVLSEDYSTDFEKHEVNIQVLREKIVELESHISIFDSVKSRACRELASKPTELRNQIFREIYRLKCRLGAFTKRLDMEKYFSSCHRFLIVQGQTGSGKSTQLPQYVADHPRFYGKKIICTQPRKLAAISLSRRVAFEYSGGMNRDDYFSYIGYQVGGDRRQMNGCRIEFVTEGIMLERIMKGDMESFRNVGCIIIDEAHERSITCDLLLGSFKKPDPRWRDLLIITTSATIDLTLFSEFFMNAPIVQIEGRTFPVDIIYQPVTDASELQLAVSKCALQIHLDCKSLPGDILCFLPGLEDITNAKSMFEKELRKVPRVSNLLDAKVFTLYGKQDPDQQAEVFEKLDASTKRKVIFATDVAETSITIDGIVYVVDSGVKKEIVFDSERNISSLKINSISKSSAIQRAGRCGRTQPGVCYRLYSEDEFESMNINAAPEVLCKPISLAVLTLLELSVDPENFDWINPPHREAIRNAEKELKILGAVDSQRKPTELGNLIAKCQQDPKIMKIVYSGCLKGFGEAASIIASILSVSNNFFWNGNDAETKTKAIEMRKKFAMPEGDVVTMYRIFKDFDDTYNRRQTKKSERSDDTIARKPASVWCNDNSLNAKSIFMALATKTELINQLKRTKIWSKCRVQNKVPNNTEVQELMCSGYFVQCARVFYSKNSNTTVEYFSTESAVAGRLDFRSSLNLLDIEPPPKWIVYDKIVRLPNTIFPIATVMDEDWLKKTNTDFYEMCLKKIEDLPTDLIDISISQVSFRMIVGRNFCNVDGLEKELGCLLTGDADTGKMHLYCAPTKKNEIQQRILSKIEDALTEIKRQVVEEHFKGETRLLIGEGYEIQEILFDKEFTTFYIKDVPETIDKAKLKNWLTMKNERIQSLDCTYHDKTYTAVAKFSSKTDAKSAFERISKVDAFTVTPSYGGGNGIRHGLISRLKLSWPTAISKGIANIFFSTAEGGNHFLDNVHYIFTNAKVHVAGETQRKAQLKMRGLRPNVVETPLTYVPFTNSRNECRFRFDVGVINQMSNKNQLNYKVTVTGLSLATDKYELQTKLNVYSPKNIILEYENFVAPGTGNGLTNEEKSMKLQPLTRFMDADTKTSDFFKRNTGIAGICIFFTSNSIAKEAYNYAKSKYSSLPNGPSLGPHRLEIEFTHTISIQIGLYTFLQPQINQLQKDGRDKGITSVIPSIQDNAKTVIVRFTTCKHSLLAWIQEKLDELVRPTKFNCPHSDVLFTWTGHLELKKFAKKTYINWSDDSHIIWVYGSADVKEKCCNDIEQIAARLNSLDVLDKEIWLKKTVRINGKEGLSINNKCKEAKIPFHHFHGNKMHISGSQQSVDTVVEFLAKNKYSWDRSKGKRFQYEDTRECGVCYMPPDNTFIMLTVCGHLFCSECIEPMVNMQPPPFPIKCPVCEEYVALYDIKKLAPAKSLERVLELAVPAFQRSHSYDIRQCPNPGCQQLLCYQQQTTGPNGGEFLFCDLCIATYCITCSAAMEKPVKCHEDDSCENVQSGVANLVFKHVRIIQNVVFNLSCPNCNTAFYEFDGCAAVKCGSCKAGFCGLCLKHCGMDAHSHVRSCPKNPKLSYFVDKSVLDAAHKDMRNQKLREYLQRHQLNAKVQQQIIEKIRKDLHDLGMTVPTVSQDAYDEPTTETSTSVWRHVRKVQESILTLSCPNCKTAFFDFDACAAVTCNSCHMEFCGLCLEFTSRSVRMHVMACPRNSKKGEVFHSSNELLNIHAAVRSDKIQSYFDEKLEDTEIKEKVLAIIRRDLNDLHIKLPDINTRRVRPPVPVRVAPVRVAPVRVAPVPVAPVRVARVVPQQRDFIRQMQPRDPVRRPAPPPPRRDCCIL